MADIFKPVIEKMVDLGMGNLFIFMLGAAVFYALLKKSQVLGESEMINGIISILAAFMIFWFPSLIGMSLVVPMTQFFTQSLVILLFLVFAFMASSMFYPDLQKVLGEMFTRRSTLWVMIVGGILLFITSGLIQTLWAGSMTPPKPGEVRVSSTISVVAAGLLVFVAVILIASASLSGD